MTKTAKECPNRIREIREACGMAQAKLAAGIKVTATQMSRLETGKRHLSLDHLRRIAGELRVSVAELLPPEDAPTLPSAREAKLLKSLREGGELAMLTAEAVAMVQLQYRTGNVPPPSKDSTKE